MGVAEAFIPTISYFLPLQTVWMTIDFASGSSTVIAARIVGKLWTPCPEPGFVALSGLLRDPVITNVVSGMLFTWKRDSLQWFLVDSLLKAEESSKH